MNQTVNLLLQIRGNANSALAALRTVQQQLAGMGASLVGFNVTTGRAQAQMVSMTASARTLSSTLQQTFVRAQQGSSSLVGGFARMTSGMVGFTAKVGLASLGINQMIQLAERMVRQIVGANASLEASTVAFATLLRKEGDTFEQSMARAEARIAELQAMNIRTPFDLESLVDADRQLQVAGVRTRELLTAMADAASITRPAFRSLNMQLREVSFGISRVAVGDFGEGFERLRELAIATRADLQAEGLRFDANGTYRGSVDDALNAVLNIMQQRFSGGAEIAATTFEGIRSNIADRWMQLRAIFGAPIFDTLKTQMQGVMTILSSQDWMSAAAVAGQAIAAGLQTAIWAFRLFQQAVFQVSQAVFSFLDRITGGLGGFAALVSAAFIPLGHALEAVVVGDFGRAGQLIVDTLANVGALIVRVMQGVADELFVGGVNTIASFADGMLSGAGTFITRALDFITGMIADFLRGFSPPPEGPLSTIDTWFPPVIEAYLESWTDADFGALTELTDFIQSRLSFLVDQGQLAATEAIRLVVGDAGQSGLTQLIAEAIDVITKTGMVPAEALMEIEALLGEQNQTLFRQIEARLVAQAVDVNIRDLKAQLAALDDPEAERALDERIRAAEEAVENARSATQQRAAKETLGILKSQQRANEQQKSALEREIELLEEAQDIVTDRVKGYEALHRLQERELSFMERLLDLEKKKRAEEQKTADDAEKHLERRADAEFEFRFATASDEEKLAMLKERLQENLGTTVDPKDEEAVTRQLEERFRLQTQIATMEARADQQRLQDQEALVDAEWDLAFAKADTAGRIELLRQRQAGVTQESAEWYILERQIYELEQQVANEKERNADAQWEYNFALADNATKLQMLQERLATLTPGTAEYFAVQAQINDVTTQQADEVDRLREAYFQYQLALADTAGKIGLLNAQLLTQELTEEERLRILDQIAGLQEQLAEEELRNANLTDDAQRAAVEGLKETEAELERQRTLLRFLVPGTQEYADTQEKIMELERRAAKQREAASKTAVDAADKQFDAETRLLITTGQYDEALARLNEKLNTLTPGSEEYLKVQNQIAQVEEQRAREQEKAAKLLDGQEAAQARLLASTGDYDGAIALLQERLSKVAVGSKEYYQIQAEIERLQKQREQTAIRLGKAEEREADQRAREAERLLDAQIRYAEQTGDFATAAALLQQKIDGMQEGTAEWFEAQSQLHALNERAAKEAEGDQRFLRAEFGKTEEAVEDVIDVINSNIAAGAAAWKEWLKNFDTTTAKLRDLREDARITFEQLTSALLGRPNETVSRTPELTPGERRANERGGLGFVEGAEFVPLDQFAGLREAMIEVRGFIEGIRDFLDKHGPVIKAAIAGIATAFAVFYIGGPIATGIAALIAGGGPLMVLVGLLGGPITVAVLAVAVVIGGLVAAFLFFRDEIQTVIDAIAPFGNIIVGVAAGLAAGFAAWFALSQLLGLLAPIVLVVSKGFALLQLALTFSGPLGLIVHGFSLLWGLFVSIGPAILGAIAALNPISLALIAIGLAVGLLVVGIITHWDEFKAYWESTIEPIWDNFYHDVLLPLVDRMRIIFRKIQESFAVLWEKLQPAFESFADLTLTVRRYLETMAPVLAVIGAVLLVLAGTIVNVLLAAFNGLILFLSEFLPGAIYALQGAIEVVLGFFGGVVDIFYAIFATILAVIQGFATGDWAASLDLIKAAWYRVWEDIKQILSGAWQIVTGLVGGLIGGIIAFFQGMYDALVGKSIIPDLVNAIVGWFQNLWDWGVEKVKGLVGAYNSSGGGILGWFWTLQDGAIAGARAMVGAYQRGGGGVLGFIAELVHWAIEGITTLVGAYRSGGGGFLGMVWTWQDESIRGVQALVGKPAVGGGGLLGLIYDLQDKAINAVTALVGEWRVGGGGVLGLFATLADTALSKITSWIGAYQTGGMLGLVQTLWTDFLGAIEGLVGLYAPGQKGVLGWFYWLFNEVLSKLIAWVGTESTAGSVLGWVQSLANSFFLNIQTLVGKYEKDGGGILGLFFNMIDGSVNAVVGWVGGYSDDGGGILGWVYFLWKTITAKAGELTAMLTAPFVTARDGIGAVLWGFVEHMITGMNKVIEAIGGMVVGFQNAINGFADAIGLEKVFKNEYKVEDHYVTIQKPNGWWKGTGSAPEGWAWVGEQGPELMWVPRTAKVMNAAMSRLMARRWGMGQGPGDDVADAPPNTDTTISLPDWFGLGFGSIWDRVLESMGVKLELPGMLGGIGGKLFEMMREGAVSYARKLWDTAVAWLWGGTDDLPDLGDYDPFPPGLGPPEIPPPVARPGLSAAAVAAINSMVGGGWSFDPEVGGYWATRPQTGLHGGIDIVLPQGRPIFAPVDGTRIQVYRNGVDDGKWAGNAFWLRTGTGRIMYFGHVTNQSMSEIPFGPIAKGNVIGWVGATGAVSGPHIHFQVTGPRGLPYVDPAAELPRFWSQISDALPPPPSGTTGVWPGTTAQNASWAKKALEAAGAPLSWLRALTALATFESGWNPFARNLNPADYNYPEMPSRGLGQTIPQTFNQWRGAGARLFRSPYGVNVGRSGQPDLTSDPGDIYDPIENLIAALRYILYSGKFGRPGSIFNLQGIKNKFNLPGNTGDHWVGYASGGVINEPIIGYGLQTGTRYAFGEEGPELIVPLRDRLVMGLQAIRSELESGLLERALGGAAEVFAAQRARVATGPLAFEGGLFGAPVYAPQFQINGVNYTLEQIERMARRLDAEGWQHFYRQQSLHGGRR